MLLVLAVCCFASALAARIIDPLVTSIARDLGEPATRVALLATAYALPYSVSQPFFGPLGDAIGKSVVLKWCLWLLAGFLALCALAPALELLFAARILGGLVAGGTMPVMLAMVGDRFAAGERQVAISRVLGAALAGQVLGATAAGMTVEVLGWRGVIAANAAIVLAAAVAATARLRPLPGAVRTPFRIPDALARYRLVFRNPAAAICYGTVFVEGIAVYGSVPYIADLLEQRQAGGPWEAGLVIAGLALGGFVFTLLVRPLLALLGTYGMMRAGGIIAALGICGLSLRLSWMAEALVFCAIGFGFYMLHNSLQTKATGLAPSARGSAVALHAFFFFLGQAAGPVLFGAGLHTVGAPVTFAVFGAAIALAGLFAGHRLERGDGAVPADG
ncbi:MFS transporter [Arenibaculum pallidiluteum]|uniref:MFS transporter n=1 Tax=Arenibaculum pallidiluteum TaxID=2812559 RepID=UPI002E2BF005|nr:MFS transporter [Arenibaculum pallidiluteum]